MTEIGLYDLSSIVKSSTNNNMEDDAIKAIITIFDPKIKSKMRYLPPHAGEDLKQELTFEITKALKKFDLDRAPSFSEYMAYKIVKK